MECRDAPSEHFLLDINGFHLCWTGVNILFPCIFYRCMEATPSLACANKCVFCWRHHTNPVGKSWQWKMDDPLEIVDAAVNEHTKMIKQMKGVPGVSCFPIVLVQLVEIFPLLHVCSQCIIIIIIRPWKNSNYLGSATWSYIVSMFRSIKS